METIKGIIRKTTTKTHIQININKVLEYLRNIGKINNRHLWSGMEIASGEEKTIWEFLDDLWYFYSNKNHDIGNRRRKLKIPISRDNHSDLSRISQNTNTNIPNFQNFYEKATGKQKEEPIILKEMNSLNYNSNNKSNTISNIHVNKKFENSELREEIEKCADFSSIHKNISNEISCALNENSTTKFLKNRAEFNNKYNNSDIIAKNLGLTKIRKRNDNIPIPSSNNSKLSISNYAINNENSNLNIKNYPPMKKAQSNLNVLPSHSSRANNSRSNLHSRSKSNLKNENESKSSEKRKDCFVIFQKTNAKKLQKEIERYNNTLVSGSGYNSENSILKNEENAPLGNVASGRLDNINLKENKNFTDNKNKNNYYTENINLPRPFTKIPTSFPENNFSSNEFPLFNTNDSTHKNEKYNTTVITENEKEEFILKEWLMSIGSKSAYKIGFTNEEVEEFKDGTLLAEIISILENKKLVGINPNATSKAAAIKNITKCLEVLRNKKVKYMNEFLIF